MSIYNSISLSFPISILHNFVLRWAHQEPLTQVICFRKSPRRHFFPQGIRHNHKLVHSAQESWPRAVAWNQIAFVRKSKVERWSHSCDMNDDEGGTIWGVRNTENVASLSDAGVSMFWRWIAWRTGLWFPKSNYASRCLCDEQYLTREVEYMFTS